MMNAVIDIESFGAKFALTISYCKAKFVSTPCTDDGNEHTIWLD